MYLLVTFFKLWSTYLLVLFHVKTGSRNWHVPDRLDLCRVTADCPFSVSDLAVVSSSDDLTFIDLSPSSD